MSENKSTVKEVIATLNSKVDNLRRDLDMAIGKTVSTNNVVETITQHKNNTDKLKESYLSFTKSYNDSITKVNSRLDELEKNNVILQNQINELEKRIFVRLDSECKSLKESVVKLEVKIDDKLSDIEKQIQF